MILKIMDLMLMFNSLHELPYYSLGAHDVNGVGNGGHLMNNNSMYGGLPHTQQQGMYGINSAQRVVNHGNYPIKHGMISQQQQVGYRSTHQPAIPNQGRHFVTSVSQSAVVGTDNNAKMISSTNAQVGINQFPPGMVNGSQNQQQNYQKLQWQQQRHRMLQQLQLIMNRPSGKDCICCMCFCVFIILTLLSISSTILSQSHCTLLYNYMDNNMVFFLITA